MRLMIIQLVIVVAALPALRTRRQRAGKSAVAKEPKGSWEVQKSGVEDDLRSVTFINDKLGWAVGAANTIIATTDGGKTWNRQVPRKVTAPTSPTCCSPAPWSVG